MAVALVVAYASVVAVASHGQGRHVARAAVALTSRSPTLREFTYIRFAFMGDKRRGHKHSHDTVTQIRITRHRPYIARVFFVNSRYVVGHAPDGFVPMVAAGASRGGKAKGGSDYYQADKDDVWVPDKKVTAQVKKALKELPDVYDETFSGNLKETRQASAPQVGDNPYCKAPAATETGTTNLEWNIKWKNVLLGQKRERADAGSTESGDGEFHHHEESGCSNAGLPVGPTNKNCSTTIEGAGGSFLKAPAYLSDYVNKQRIHVLTFGAAAAIPKDYKCAVPMAFEFSPDGPNFRYVLYKAVGISDDELAKGQDFAWNINITQYNRNCYIFGRGSQSGQKCTDMFQWSGKVAFKVEKANEEP